MVKALLFDLDGVITDTAERHYLAWQQLATEQGWPFTRTDNEPLRGLSRQASLAAILPSHHHYSATQLNNFLAYKNHFYVESLSHLSEQDILPGMLSLLLAAQQQGIKLAIASASKNACLILERLGLVSFFNGVADGHAVQRTKHFADIFIYAAGLVQTPIINCVVIEDSAIALQAAKEAKFCTVGIGATSAIQIADVVFDRTEKLTLPLLLSHFS